jgi:hypothetical protein
MLVHYVIELHLLTLGGVLHVIAFIMLCEAFLEILPHSGLWKYFFDVYTEDRPLLLIWGVILQSCTGRARRYLQLSVSTLGEGWQWEWFPFEASRPLFVFW